VAKDRGFQLNLILHLDAKGKTQWRFVTAWIFDWTGRDISTRFDHLTQDVSKLRI
jgi:hypothetical protein